MGVSEQRCALASGGACEWTNANRRRRFALSARSRPMRSRPRFVGRQYSSPRLRWLLLSSVLPTPMCKPWFLTFAISSSRRGNSLLVLRSRVAGVVARAGGARVASTSRCGSRDRGHTGGGTRRHHPLQQCPSAHGVSWPGADRALQRSQRAVRRNRSRCAHAPPSSPEVPHASRRPPWAAVPFVFGRPSGRGMPHRHCTGDFGHRRLRPPHPGQWMRYRVTGT
jgi:hypothetical protein